MQLQSQCAAPSAGEAPGEEGGPVEWVRGMSLDGQAYLTYRQPGGGQGGRAKKISVPENFSFFPGGGLAEGGRTAAHRVALQQQLMQHRLQQKRQHLQKQRLMGPGGQGGCGEGGGREALLVGRRCHARGGQGFSKPYLPTDALPLVPQGSEFLFQPIAEDEPSPTQRVEEDAAGWQQMPAAADRQIPAGAAAVMAPPLARRTECRLRS